MSNTITHDVEKSIYRLVFFSYVILVALRMVHRLFPGPGSFIMKKIQISILDPANLFCLDNAKRMYQCFLEQDLSPALDYLPPGSNEDVFLEMINEPIHVKATLVQSLWGLLFSAPAPKEGKK